MSIQDYCDKLDEIDNYNEKIAIQCSGAKVDPSTQPAMHRVSPSGCMEMADYGATMDLHQVSSRHVRNPGRCHLDYIHADTRAPGWARHNIINCLVSLRNFKPLRPFDKMTRSDAQIAQFENLWCKVPTLPTRAAKNQQMPGFLCQRLN